MNNSSTKKNEVHNESSQPESMNESTKLLESSSEDFSPLSISDVVTSVEFGRYHILTMITVLIGYSGRHALLDMMPVLSTRLYVEMNLTPELESALATVTFVGMALSYIITGVVANMIGRKACALWGTLWIIFWNTLCAAAWNIESLIVFRLFWSLGACCMAALDIHICEVMPRQHTWAGVLIAIYGGEALGKILPYSLGAVMFSDKHRENMWPYFVVILSIPSFLFIALALLFMDESPTYLWSKGKSEQATRVLKKFFPKDDSKSGSEKFFNYDNIDFPEKESDNSSAWEKVKVVLKNVPVLRSLICVTIIGCSVKYTTFGLSYIATELVFLSGQTDSNYCAGTKSKTYFLESSDYLVLSAFMISAFLVKILAMIIAKKFDMGFKKSGAVCLGISVCLAASLYACPDYWVALIIYGLIDASSAIVEIYYIVFVSEIVPANIRSTIYGFMKFLMYLLLPTTPYLIQILAKESQHYLTSTTLSLVLVSFIAVLLIPNKVQTDHK